MNKTKRLGPARLYQFRKDCGVYNSSWNYPFSAEQFPDFNGNYSKEYSKLKSVLEESPVKKPFLQSSNADATIPADWASVTTLVRSLSEFGECSYEAELGHTKSSGRFMAELLKSENWLDTRTTLLFFEQTYINIPLRTVSQWTP